MTASIRNIALFLVAYPLIQASYAQKTTAVFEPPVPAATARQEAQPGNLALIPSDSELFCTIPDLPGFINTLPVSLWSRIVKLDENNVQYIKDSIAQSGILSATISTGPHSSKDIAQLFSLFVRLSYAREQMRGQMAIYKAKRPPETPIDDAFYAEEDRLILEYLLPVLEDCPTAPVPNVLVIFELSPERAAMIRSILASSRQTIEELVPRQFRTTGLAYTEGTFAGRFWQGLRFNGAKQAQYFQQKWNNIRENEREFAHRLLARLTTRQAYLLSTMQGDTLIVSLCTAPDQDIKIARTPQESVLSTDKTALADGIPDKNIDLFFHIDRQFHNTLAAQLSAISGIGRTSSIVPTPRTSAILDTFGSLLAQTQAAPVSGIIWKSQGIHALLSYGKDNALDDTQATIDRIHADIDNLHGSITPGNNETRLRFHLPTP